MYSKKDIANYFLSNVDGVTPKKLQKLCYYAEAWTQALLDRDLMVDAKFEAWIHGPVDPGLYQDYKENGWNTIEKPENNDFDHISEDVIELLDSVISTYGDLSGNELEAITHRETPWIEARNGYGENDACNVELSKETMKDYYRQIYIGD